MAATHPLLTSTSLRRASQSAALIPIRFALEVFAARLVRADRVWNGGRADSP